MEHKFSLLKISDIGKMEGIQEIENINSDYSITSWLIQIRHKKISELSNFDLSRFLRQELFLKYICYEVISRLKTNPFQGHMREGELLELLSRLNKEFWEENPSLQREIILLLDIIFEKHLPFIKEDDWFDDGDIRYIFHSLYKLTSKLQILYKYADAFIQTELELRALDYFGKQLIKEVRDNARREINSKFNNILKENNELSKGIQTLNKEQIQMLRSFIMTAVDTLLYQLLFTLDQNPEIKINVDIDGQEVKDIGNNVGTNGLYSNLFGPKGWIARYSSEKE
ncbi:contact-dependent growth inhibition system immunity protein [Lihuaxuella thermophila]|nr:contact-dependent growth inhibition system immunity protein [Lihuaxuella thermophila]